MALLSTLAGIVQKATLDDGKLTFFLITRTVEIRILDQSRLHKWSTSVQYSSSRDYNICPSFLSFLYSQTYYQGFQLSISGIIVVPKSSSRFEMLTFYGWGYYSHCILYPLNNCRFPHLSIPWIGVLLSKGGCLAQVRGLQTRIVSSHRLPGTLLFEQRQIIFNSINHNPRQDSNRGPNTITLYVRPLGHHDMHNFYFYFNSQLLTV